MIYTLSWTTKKHQKNSFQATTYKVEENSRTFKGKMAFKDFQELPLKFKDCSRLCEPCLYWLYGGNPIIDKDRHK